MGILIGMRRAAYVGLALVAAAATICCVGVPSAGAVVEVPFATQFASNGRGDLTIAANTLETCPEAAPNCTAARAGTATGGSLNNNGYAMERVDVDGDPGTFDSSTATLALPPGATVTFAGLYYGGRLSKGGGAGAEAAPEPTARGTLLLRTPGSIAYTPLGAAVTDSAGIAAAYTGFVDVTARVAAAGAGEYTVADVQAGTGEDRYAGWSLIVAYSDPSASPRSIRVFGGLASIVQKSPPEPLQIPITGLETPPAGTVSADVALVAYEGDRGSAGDSLSLAGRDLADAANPANNVFNSSISVGGTDVATKNPNYVDQLGFDADLIGADGFLANDATGAVLEESTNVEQYLTQAVAVSIELDPAALEPPMPPVVAPPAPTPPTPAPAKEKKRRKPPAEPKQKEPQGPSGAEPASVELTVAPLPETVRPTAVVPVRVTVAAGGDRPLSKLSICNRLSTGLVRLRAAGAKVDGPVACWHLDRLGAGHRRTFLTTARVAGHARGTLSIKTTVNAADARKRVRRASLEVAPLPPTGCAAIFALTQQPLRRRC
jgi:hypothetical protein